MVTPALGKRKETLNSPKVKPHRPAKRVKIDEARTILTQTSDKALNHNGDLNVASFVKAREFEIKAMGASMASSKNALSTRAFQQVPRDMRRRTASHNVKRVPKRLRAKASREMKEDKTPTATARRRAPTTHKRLRLEKAKKLMQLGALTKKRAQARDQKQNETQEPGEADRENASATVPRLPKLKKDTLTKPPKAPARFRKRQIHKSWLPTHVWHAKRAKMTEPKNPLWRYAMPLSPTEKCFRVSHRANTLRGCVGYDTSYMGTIGVEGVEASLVGMLKALGIEDAVSMEKREERWRRGTRSWEGWIRERDEERKWIAPVLVLWCVDGERPLEHDAEREKKKIKRRLFIRVHPSAFLQAWDEVLKVAKIQRPQAIVEDLRFEIGSIEITGPDAMEALVGVLNPISDTKPEASLVAGTQATTNRPTVVATDAATSGGSDGEEWVDIPSPSEVFPRLSAITNPASLPPNALLAFVIRDPRIYHPPRTHIPSADDDDVLLSLLSTWPPDQTLRSASLFDRTHRLIASRLPSQKTINRRKTEAGAGNFPSLSSKDPKIPVMLVTSRAVAPGSTVQRGSPGSYTVLLPWSCVQPVWYSLMHYPLSSGGTPRFGGLQEKRQTAFESQTPWFPGDFPGTKAGWAWEMMEREWREQEWQRRPKGKRCEWDSVDVGGKKGEVGLGLGCDWDRLFARVSTSDATASVKVTNSNENTTAAEVTSTSSRLHSKPRKELSEEDETLDDGLPTASLSISHLMSSSLISKLPADIPPTAVTPIHLTLLTTGHPARNARIYRLPTASADLRARWLALLPSSTVKHPDNRALSNGKGRPPLPLPKSAPRHVKAQRLAASLITEAPLVSSRNKATVMNPSDPEYPPVPDEVDLIGFVTSANFQLGVGRCEAIGNIVVARVLESGNEDADKNGGAGRRAGNDGTMSILKGEAKLCIVRDAGQSIGRLARWAFA